MRAWLFQDSRQKAKLGSKAPWSVGYFDPEGRKKSKRVGSKSAADKYRRKVEGQLAAGTYQATSNTTWEAFRAEYETRIMSGMPPGSKGVTSQALNHFERIAAPVRLDTIKTQHIDDFISSRRLERGAKKGSTVSPATINKELRHVKAALRIAHDWGYLSKVPKVRMVREPKKLARYVPPDHFEAIYRACDTATRPVCTNYTPGDWWRALLMTAYMTGWRINELMLLRRANVDLESGVAILEANETKRQRAERLPLHPVVIEHLALLPGFSIEMFPFGDLERTFLWDEFGRIQRAAGIELPCTENHEHTPACHVYGFHDLRRAFATMNVSRLSAEALQSLMRHESYATTQKYINMANELTKDVQGLYVPTVGRKATS